MPRIARQAPGGIVYHVLNRGGPRGGRMTLFDKPADYDAFIRVVEDTLLARPMRILGYCLMPNHWHLVLWPRENGDLAAFMQRLTITHVRRWLEHRHLVGTGHVYQGRFKSFAVEADEHLCTLLRYVERNPLRANLVKRAEDWQWSSLRRRCPPASGTKEATPSATPSPTADADRKPLLTPLPIDLPADWVKRVNRPETSKELERLRTSVNRGRPFGGEAWTRRTVARLGLPATLRGRGRPRKEERNEAT